MLGEATLHVSRTFAGERNTASHSVCRPAKALPWGLWHPILMQFYSGPLMHLLSGVDIGGRNPRTETSTRPCPLNIGIGSERVAFDHPGIRKPMILRSDQTNFAVP